MADQDLLRSLGQLEQSVADVRTHLQRHVVEQKDDFMAVRQQLDSLTERVLLLRTEHVIVRAGASTIVKATLWLAAVVGGAAAAWDWIRQHVNFQ